MIKPKRSAPVTPAARAPRKRQSRQDLLPAARETIFNAAAQVVGELGYERASIKRITQAAGIAEGTFYLYFESRQSLFDQLLPHFGSDMLAFVARRIAGARDIFDMEERGFRAFFLFLKDNRWFFRVLIEAEVAAPRAYAEHFRLLAEGYRRALSRGIERGEIRDYDSEEIEAVACADGGHAIISTSVTCAMRPRRRSARESRADLPQAAAWRISMRGHLANISA